MREINFIEVGMENFGPYIEPMVLTFENDKLTLITGPNGIGKTMSLEAIPFTLFGETCKKAKGDDVVNTRIGKNCHTWVKFSINSDTYLVDRYHKYKSLGNTVTIQKNGEDPYLKGHREVLPEVEKLICSKKSFTNTLMFGQKVKDFFTDLIDSDKKEIFRKILDLDIYTQWYKEADNDLKEIKAKLQKLIEQIGIERGILANTEQQIEILFAQKKEFDKSKQNDIDTIKKSLEENQRLLSAWKEDRLKTKTKEEDLEKIQVDIDDVKQQLQHHENEKEKVILKLHSSRDAKLAEILDACNKAKENVVKENRKIYDSLLETHNKEGEKLATLFNETNAIISSNDSELSSIETEKRIKQKDIDKLQSSLKLSDGACPTCLRDIDDSCRDHLKQELHKHQDELYILNSREEQINQNHIELYKKLDDIKNSKKEQETAFKVAKNKLLNDEEIKMKEIGDKLDIANAKVYAMAKAEAEKIGQDYDQYITGLREKLDELYSIKTVISDTLKKVSEIDHAIANLEQAIKGYELRLKMAEEGEYDTTQLAVYQMRKSEMIKAIEEMNVEFNSLQKEEELSTFWKAAWSPTGIPSMLIDEAIPFMNEKVSEYLDRLTNGRYIVSFDTLAATKAGEFRDKISVNVLDTYTRANSRIQLSGGQTRLVDIATILTLGDLQASIQDVSINILLFDEIFDSLDEENIGFVSNILGQLKIGKSIYLISHTQVDQLEADEILEFK